MWLNLFLTVLLGIQVYFTIRSVVRYYKTNDLEWYQKRLEEFSKELIEHAETTIDREITAFKKSYEERVDLLSKENARLIEKNEILQDKLKNLGFKDYQIDN